jgi:uncharacterized protein HemX
MTKRNSPLALVAIASVIVLGGGLLVNQQIQARLDNAEAQQAAEQERALASIRQSSRPRPARTALSAPQSVSQASQNTTSERKNTPGLDDRKP